MDYVVNQWQEIVSLMIVASTIALFIKREISVRLRRKKGLCSHDEHCSVAKLHAMKRT